MTHDFKLNDAWRGEIKMFYWYIRASFPTHIYIALAYVPVQIIRINLDLMMNLDDIYIHIFFFGHKKVYILSLWPWIDFK